MIPLQCFERFWYMQQFQHSLVGGLAMLPGPPTGEPSCFSWWFSALPIRTSKCESSVNWWRLWHLPLVSCAAVACRVRSFQSRSWFKSSRCTSRLSLPRGAPSGCDCWRSGHSWGHCHLLELYRSLITEGSPLTRAACSSSHAQVSWVSLCDVFLRWLCVSSGDSNPIGILYVCFGDKFVFKLH